MRDKKVVGMVAVANKPGGYTEVDRAILTRLASVICVSTQHRAATIAAKRTQEELELLVEERTKELQEEIVERNHIQDKLIEAELKYRTIADFTYDWEWWQSPKGEFIYVSRSCKRITGHDASDFIVDADLFHRIIHPNDTPIWDNHRHLSAKGEVESSIEFRIIHKDGSEHWIEHVCQPVFDSTNKFIGTRGSNRDITMRKQAEENLRESEERYRDVVESTAAWIWEIDVNGKYTYASDVCENILGYKPEELVGKYFYDLFSPDEREKYKEAAFEAFAKKQPFREFINMNLHKNGKEIWLSTSGVPVLDENGELLGYRGADTNITERKKMEDELRKSEERFRLIAETSVDYIFQLDRQGILTYASPAIKHILGYKPEDRIGHHFSEFIPSGYKEAPAMFNKLIRGEAIKNLQIDLCHENGNKVPVEMSLSPAIQDGEVTSIYAIVRDITERQQAEAALRESEEKLRNMFERANDGIVLMDLNGRIMEVNDSACRMVGIDNKEEVVGRSAFDFITSSDRGRASQDLQDFLKRGPFPDPQYSAIQKDGSIIPIEINAGILTDARRKPNGVVAILRDISERTALDEERQRGTKLESIGTLAGGIAHDFNNYLTSVIGNISLARKYVESGSVTASHLLEAEEAVIQARDLTQQLLTFARGGSPIKKTVSIGSLLEDTTRFALRGSSVKPEFSIPDNLWSAEADESQIRQVISNLSINAVEAMQGGGFIQIKAENHVIKRKGVIPLPEGNYIQLTITDHGSGITKEHLTRIFDPYFTTKKSGSGLGLATVYSIIKAHGGHIDVKSHDGAGTTFRIFLPASNKSVPRPKAQRKIRQLSLLKNSRILIMDDNEPIRKMLGEILSDMECEVGFAADGKEAIKQYVEAEKNGRPFDVVIMDLTIEGGMGGMEAIKQLLQIDPGASVIVSSGYSTHPMMSDYKKYGFSGVLRKPYDIDELENTIEGLLKRRKRD